MAYIGKIPTAAPLTSSDVADGIITNAKLAQDIISAETELAESPASTDEFLISDGGTLKRLDASYIGGNNTPQFFAYKTATQGITEETYTKVTFQTELYDAGGDFDLSNDKFVTGETGKFFLFAQVGFFHSSNNAHEFRTAIYKNGSILVSNSVYLNNEFTNNIPNFFHVSIIDNSTSASDYYEIYARCDYNATTGSPQVTGGSGQNGYTSYETHFGGFKLIQ
jgi:hypothetical protein